MVPVVPPVPSAPHAVVRAVPSNLSGHPISQARPDVIAGRPADAVPVPTPVVVPGRYPTRGRPISTINTPASTTPVTPVDITVPGKYPTQGHPISQVNIEPDLTPPSPELLACYFKTLPDRTKSRVCYLPDVTDDRTEVRSPELASSAPKETP